MNTKKPQLNQPEGIEKVTHTPDQSDHALNAILREVFQTREVRQLLITVVPEFLNVWAGRSWWKKRVSSMAGYMVDNQLSQPEDIFENSEIDVLFENEEFIKNVSEQLPGVIKGLLNAIAAGTGSIEAMSAEDKKQLLTDLFSQTGDGQTGKVLNHLARTLVEVHSTDPEFFTKALAPGFQKWVESVDFGEIREMLNASAEDGRAFIKMLNQVFWLYPSKVVMLLSMGPSLINLIMDALDISLEQLNDEMPPDMETDVIFALIKDIKMESVANVLNHLMEVVRKIHVGSALMGEGTPVLPILLSNIIGQIIDKTDPVTFWKAKIALAETKANVSQIVSRSVKNRPSFKHLSLIKGPEITNIHLKSLNTLLSEWDAEDDEELAKSFGQHIAAYDVQEIAEVLNNSLRIINRLGDEKPAIFSEFAAQLVDAIDHYELAETAKRLFGGLSRELQPTARAVVPGLVTWVCDVIKPEDDEYEEDAARAREALLSLYAGEEV